MKKIITSLIVIMALVITFSLTPVIANEDIEQDIALFSSENTDVETSYEDIETNNSSQDSVTHNDNSTDNNTVSNNSQDSETSNDNEINQDDQNYNNFKSEWYSSMNNTEYQRYSNHKKTIQEMREDNSFNCYDGAYYTGFIATKYGLDYEIVHGYWGGVGHGATRVYHPNGSYELFDTTQLQKGYGKDGLEDSIYWDKIDDYSTEDSKKENKQLLKNSDEKPVNKENNEEKENKENSIHEDKYGLSSNLDTDLSVDLSSDLSFDTILNLIFS